MHDDDTRPIMKTRWWHYGLSVSDHSWLQDTSYNQFDHDLIYAFAGRWHEETSSFHVLFREMTVTFDDVSCLLHLFIDGMLLSHESISRDDAVEMMRRYLGSSPRNALDEATETRGAHARISYLRRIRFLQQLKADNEGGIEDEVQKMWDQALCIYLMYLVGITLFTDKSATYVDVVYLRYFRDPEVSGFSQGVVAPRVGFSTPDEYRGHLDALDLSGIIMAPYGGHRQACPFEWVSLYSGWIRYGNCKVRYLSERVLLQFSTNSDKCIVEEQSVYFSYYNFCFTKGFVTTGLDYNIVEFVYDFIQSRAKDFYSHKEDIKIRSYINPSVGKQLD